MKDAKGSAEKRRLALENATLHEVGIKKKLGELRPEQRRALQRFCGTWKDILINLRSLRRGTGMKERIMKLHSQQPSQDNE